jgi:regulator of nucleoside diphosphate kinase
VKNNSIVVTDTDMDRLSRLVRASRLSLLRDRPQLDLLQQVLDSAEVWPSERVPKGVVRVHSRARIRDFDTRQQEAYVLVLPDEADASRGFISVLAPLGMALLGHRKGDVIQAKVPGGTRRLRIQLVSQQDSKDRSNSASDRSQELAESGLRDRVAA